MNTASPQSLRAAASLAIAVLLLVSCLDPQAGTVKASDVAAETGVVDTFTGADDSGTEVDVGDAEAEAVIDAEAEAVMDAVAEVAVDVAMDAAMEASSDLDATDVSPPEGLVEGLWLIGWSGALDHFDWLRFEPLDASGVGAVRWTGAKADMQALTPLSDCDGIGSWRYVGDTSADGSETVEVTPPAGCQGLFYDPDGNDSAEVMVFSAVADGGWFGQEAVAHATVTPVPASEFGESWTGLRFPPSWCAPDLSVCSSPYPSSP